MFPWKINALNIDKTVNPASIYNTILLPFVSNIGKYVLQEKLDYNTLNGYEISSILKARDRKLVVPVMYNNSMNDYQVNNNEEVNRIEYV